MGNKNEQIPNESSTNELLKVMTANKWIEEAKLRPIPKVLFSEFWFEGEVCILYADTNLGKSILAVQISESIASGVTIPEFKLDALKQNVVYLDFELTDKQFEARYSESFKNHYKFNENLFRAEINPDGIDCIASGQNDFSEYLYSSIENYVLKSNTKILIVDNLTYLRNDTEQSKGALPLMKQLKTLKNKYGLSILVLAHTPKRDSSNPISRNDLKGSKDLINFCDSAFAIGESQKDNSLRYLKQIKSRNTEIIFDDDNVCVCRISKPSNFLGFEFVKFDSEYVHLKKKNEKDDEKLKEKIIEQHSKGMSYRNIAKQLNTNHRKVGRVIDKNKLDVINGTDGTDITNK